MNEKAWTTYYFLSTVVLAAGFFVIQPTQIPEMQSFQNNVKHQVSVAWQQTIGDGPWFNDVQFVYDSVDSFYQQAATTTIAMIQDRESDADISYVFGTMYHDVAAAFQPKEIPKVAGVATQAVQEFKTVNDKPPGASTNVPNSQPANSENSWVTLQDNATGQLYCIAIYDGEVNKYMGPCQRDYH